MSYPLRNYLAALAGLFLFGLGALRAELAVGDRFPDLTAFGLQGDLPATSGKVVVVDFCASWCAPCRQSFPALTAVQKDYAERGVVVLGVSVDARAADYQGMLRKWSPGFPVVHDAGQKLVAVVKVPTMPTSYVVDAGGVIRAIHVGFHSDTPQQLRADLNSLLKP